jgi:hypothetical protein
MSEDKSMRLRKADKLKSEVLKGFKIITCQSCGKELSNVNPHTRYCDVCKKIRTKQVLDKYRHANMDKFVEYGRRARKKFKDTINQKAAERRKTPETKEYSRRYCIKNKDKKREYDKERYKKIKIGL